MSVFLMGSYDAKSDKFCTVTKCGNGHDDATLEKINKQLKDEVVKISKVRGTQFKTASTFTRFNVVCRTSRKCPSG